MEISLCPNSRRLPALATTSFFDECVRHGGAFSLVLIFSNLMISALKSMIPEQIRIPCYIVVIASLVTVTEMLMGALVPDIYAALGIFIPLIVVNCIILGRAEAFASKRGVFASLQDALGMGLGFTLALASVGSIRELLGAGTLLGFPVLGSSFQPIMLMAQPPGAFITMGFLFAGVNYLKQRKEARHG
jgi:electron transport complex protein RnfE